MLEMGEPGKGERGGRMVLAGVGQQTVAKAPQGGARDAKGYERGVAAGEARVVGGRDADGRPDCRGHTGDRSRGDQGAKQAIAASCPWGQTHVHLLHPQSPAAPPLQLVLPPCRQWRQDLCKPSS